MRTDLREPRRAISNGDRNGGSGSQRPPTTSEHPPTEPRPGRHRVRFSLAWFAGADLAVLERAEADKSFYNALGATVLLLSCASGIAWCLVWGYVLHVSPGQIWWTGALWTLILACGIERLVLQVTGARKRWMPVVILPRLCLAILLAVQLGEPLMLRINEDQIDAEITLRQAEAKERVRADTKKSYDDRIFTAKDEIATLRKREIKVRNDVTRYRFLASRKPCNRLCRHYARRADNRAQDLQTIRMRHSGRVRGLKERISKLRADKQAEIDARFAAIDRDTGLPARHEALAALVSKHPSLSAEIWFLRLFFIALDLVPLAAKVVRMLTGDSPYEAHMAAKRRQEMAEAYQEAEAARVKEQRVKKQARADEEVDGVVIDLDADKRIRDAEAASGHATGGTWQRSARTGPIEGQSLGEYVEGMRRYEAEHVPVPEELRRGGRIGLAVAGVSAIAMTTWTALTDHALAGTWIVLSVLALITALAVYTRGFQRAPGWGLRAILASLIAGMTLPIVVLVLNL